MYDELEFIQKQNQSHKGVLKKLKFAKPGDKGKKRKKPIPKRAKCKMDDGRKDLEDKCMNLWRRIVSHNKCKCEWCRKPALVYQCHHVITKSSSAALKYDSENGIYLCKGCHFRVHNHNSMDFSLWFDKKFPGRYERLLLRKNNFCAQTASNLTLIKTSLENEFKKIADNLKSS